MAAESRRATEQQNLLLGNSQQQEWMPCGTRWGHSHVPAHVGDNCPKTSLDGKSQQTPVEWRLTNVPHWSKDCWMTVGVENNISSKYPETRSDRTSPCHMPSSTEPITVVRGVLILIGWGLSCRIHSQSWGCLNQALWTKVGKDRTLHKIGAFVRRRNKFIGRWTNVHERRYSKKSQQDCTYYVCLASLHSHFQAHMIPNQNGSKSFTPFHTLTLKDKMENNIHLPGLPRWEVTFLVKL